MISKYQRDPGIPTTGYTTFVEPFFGGGAMMVYLYHHAPHIKRFVINDINPELMGIYRAIKTDVRSFLHHLDQLTSEYLPLDHTGRKAWYYDVRTQYTTDYQAWGSIRESATLYFLMKTGFNGIWQTNKASRGRFATPAGLLNHIRTVHDVENIWAWNRFLQQADLHCDDWRTVCDTISDPSFFFFDPPYRNSFTQYGQVFTDADHDQLIRYSQSRANNGDVVMYCNRHADDTFYEDRRGTLRLTEYPITYTAGRRKKHGDGSHSAKAATEILLSYVPPNSTE